jgi:hypothetical protein
MVTRRELRCWLTRRHARGQIVKSQVARRLNMRWGNMVTLVTLFAAPSVGWRVGTGVVRSSTCKRPYIQIEWCATCILIPPVSADLGTLGPPRTPKTSKNGHWTYCRNPSVILRDIHYLHYTSYGVYLTLGCRERQAHHEPLQIWVSRDR